MNGRRPGRWGLTVTSSFPLSGPVGHTHTPGTAPPLQSHVSVKGGREGEGCPQSACAYWLAPWGCVQSSRQGQLSAPTLRHTDNRAKMESQECSPTTQGTDCQLRVRSPPRLSPFPPGGAKNSCGLPRSGKVVGVGLDLSAELAGQSGYSSARSQGNSWSMWGKGGG